MSATASSIAVSNEPTRSRNAALCASGARPAWIVVGSILFLAAALRLWGIGHDLPFSFYGDELHFMKRSMAMGTGDLNPHWFHKPAFLMYVLLATYGAMFAVGLVVGWFHSTAEFGAYFLKNYGPFLLAGRLVVVAFGVAAVYFTYRLGRELLSSRAAGFAAATAAAVVPGLVASGQHIKSDVPCAAFMIAALAVYWRTRRAASPKSTIAAGLLSGAAMGMHFYALVLVPTYVVLETVRVLRREVSTSEAIRRLAVLGAAFGIGMLVTSPYTLLDREGTAYVHPEQDGVNFVPYTRALPFQAWWYTPTVYVLHVLVSGDAFGPWLTVLAAIGMLRLLLSREMRDRGLLIAVPVVSFIVIAANATGYQAEPRHLSPLYPLLAIAAWSGAQAVARRFAGHRAAMGAIVVMVAALVPSVVRTAANDRGLMLPDSRVVAYRWIMSSLPHDGRVLLDDYGPELPENEAAVRRLQAKLTALPPGPFTAHQDQRLDLLRRFPNTNGFDVESLGHQWWLGKELSDEDILRSAFHRNMSDPLISRVPKTVAEYRALGFRWIVTNSVAQSRYRRGYPDRDKFPSFAAFYDELPRQTHLVKQFDPASWGGKGPVISIYDLRSQSN
jgi:hypothetical protein